MLGDGKTAMPFQQGSGASVKISIQMLFRKPSSRMTTVIL